MLRVGLSIDLVLKKIRSTESRFDVSTAGLIELRKKQIPDEVIGAMIERQSQVGENRQFSESGPSNDVVPAPPVPTHLDGKSILAAAKTIAIEKSSANPSRQALEKELLKRPEFQATGLSIIRYKDTADLYVEIGFVPLSILSHRYVYRIFDRRGGVVLAAGETTSWGSLAENLARHIAKSLAKVRSGG